MRDSVKEQLGDEEESEINLTPMLDVVFIMLIFFIVTAVFIREPGVDIERPTANRVLTPTASIFVAITAEGSVWIDGDEVALSDARFAIERLRAENPEGGVIIQSDQAARNEVLIAVMDAAKEAGIQEITVAAGEN